MAKITARQIQLIQKEAYRQIKEKAQAEADEARKRWLNDNHADRQARMIAAIEAPDFIANLKNAVMSVEPTEYWGRIPQEISNFLETAMQCGAEPRVSRPKTIHFYGAYSGLPREVHMDCLEEKADAYARIIKEVATMELDITLGADARALLENINDRIAKL